jgi:TonB family protein
MKYILTTLLISCAFLVIAQKKQNIYYVNDQNVVVDHIDSASYIRIVQEPDSGSNLYNLFEYYKDEKIKRMGKLSEFEPLQLEGTIVSYYKNGKRSSVENYTRNIKTGRCFSFYENGNLLEEIEYLEIINKTQNKDFINYKMIQVGDSLGYQFLDENGSGTFLITKANGDTESGTYLNGLKNGLCKSFNSRLKENYEDVYENGKFINGKTVHDNGEILTYQVLEQLPEFKGGLQAFATFLQKNLRYPKNSRERGIQGRVHIGFVIEKDGTPTDFKVIKSIAIDINNEAVRVLKLSPNWTPGLQRGKSVRMSYIMPIIFKLAK